MSAVESRLAGREIASQHQQRTYIQPCYICVHLWSEQFVRQDMKKVQFICAIE